MEQKNFLLAMVLIIGFLLLWSMFVIPRFTPPPPPAGVTQIANAPQAATPELKSAHAETGQPVTSATRVLRDETNEIVLASKGGAIQTWRVKTKGEEVDLVLHPEEEPLPLTTFPDTDFKMTPHANDVTMEATLPNGVRVTKTLVLSPTGHLHQLTMRFQNPTAQALDIPWDIGWGPGIGTIPTEQKENVRTTRALNLGKINVHKLKDGMQEELGRWAAVDNRYFLVAFVPETSINAQVAASGAKDQTRINIHQSTQVPAHGAITQTYDLYVGPKGYTQLKTYGKDLQESVDFGTFSGLGKLILSAMYRLQSLTGNYGVAIILLTIGIQVLMFPLTIKSFKATMAMKKLQPKIAEIQARFKNDPKRLNIEMMNVYKSTGTNPFGGCLPMLLQLPIFWALFTMLRNAYELRGAPFFGWIHDLSTPDTLLHLGGFPVHVLPLIMGVAMFFQQRMSGAASDPTQKQMMMMMPIMFTFMFYGFPAGLVLYWLTNNLMTMGIQFGFQRLQKKDPSRVVNTTIVK